ncbi:stealth family protein [Blastococcus goldschmidtiae]|uniref:Stealth family protein n=1 Tax=Blastococcus goldschmidtiae TaxID=3075546 RepID=A0ABU2K499_9ACTN|nr:stealth family protein [Blastococcus sp. DSM 46792]MDT0275017.1 stealth family protein [Blastococcus sp. DSM 46792]
MRSTVAALVPQRVQQKVYRAVPAPVWELVRDVGTGATPWQRRAREARLRRLQQEAVDAVDVPVTAVTYQGERFLARPLDRFRAADVLAGNAGLVADALEAAGIRYLVIDAPVQRNRVLAVAADDRAGVRAALAAAGDRLPLYARQLHPADDRPSALVTAPRAFAEGGSAYTVFQVYAAQGRSEAVSGPDLGCHLEFWDTRAEDSPADNETGEPLSAGSWVAPRRNRWADAVPAELLTPVRRSVDGVTRPCLPTLSERHAFDVHFPIDAVYTWVDGNDPAWQRRKAAAQGAGERELNEFASNDSRFLSRDELRYSLRSLDMYAGWIRHVYLVTDQQVPEWLDTSNTRITVVDHRDLFGGRGQLPTFNSHAIESQLHHIPGLSDHYLYLNDDVFFGRPVGPEQFFAGNGLAHFFTSPAKIGLGDTGAFDRPVMSGAKNNRDLLFKTFDRAITSKFKHVPIAQRRDVLLELEERCADVFAETARHQFRDPADIAIASSLHHYYAFLTGRAVEGRLRYFYTDIAAPETAGRLRRLLRTRDRDVMCLNDHDSSGLDPELQHRMLHAFLTEYFPLPSSFEK